MSHRHKEKKNNSAQTNGQKSESNPEISASNVTRTSKLKFHTNPTGVQGFLNRKKFEQNMSDE